MPKQREFIVRGNYRGFVRTRRGLPPKPSQPHPLRLTNEVRVGGVFAAILHRVEYDACSGGAGLEIDDDSRSGSCALALCAECGGAGVADAAAGVGCGDIATAEERVVEWIVRPMTLPQPCR